ncbi:ABC transporter permease [Propionicicella superfundia]|uniref:ABC transporter permease n=1 Tax=Propionicicella superfundia TaxID=348582 RepID=UPI000411B6F2|nr:ABC transporter permease [Propionicicella superfundia]
MSSPKSLGDHIKILRILVSRDLKVRYSSSFLGYLWTVIDPLASALIYYMLFVVIFKRSDAGYSPYFLFLLSGILPWQWFNAAVSESTRALTSQALLVKSTNLPRVLWVLRLVLSKGVEFLLSMPVLVLFWVIYYFQGHAHLDWEVVYLPIGLLLQAALCLGVGLILAPVTVIVTDMQPLIRIVLRILFYLTPIIFTLNHVPEWLRLIFYANPMTGILEFYRAGLFPNPVNWNSVLSGVVGTAILLGLGWLIFSRMEKTVLKEI